MADTQNPIDPQNQQGTATSGPARSAPAAPDASAAYAALDAFNRAVPVIKDMADQVAKFAERMEKAGKNTESAKKKIRDMGNEMRHSIAYADSFEETIRSLYDYQRKMNKEGLKAKSYKEVLKLLHEMEDQNKRLVEHGVFSKQNTRVIERNTQAIRRGISQLNTEMGQAFDPNKVERIVTQMARMSRETLNVAKNIKGIRAPGVQGDFQRAEHTFRHVFRVSDRAKKYRDYGAVAKEIRLARKDSLAGRGEAFATRRDKIRQDTDRLAIRLNNRWGHYTATPEDIGKFTTQKARKSGYGRLGAAVIGRDARAAAQGRSPGILTKAGMGLLARGEGSIGRGIASAGAGMIEGGLAGVAEAAGPLAPVLAVLEIVKAAFDKNQVMNSEVAEGLGKGGIYGGGGNPLWAIRNVRSNLNGPLYSPLGMGYEKNLAIAKSLQEGGFATANLASEDLGRDGQGFVRGSFGSLQRNVYAYGRMAGLDSSQTMTETIKLVSQYRMSLGSTHDFYLQLTKDAAAANITTTKWIQLQDDVQSHYERSNKLLEATVDTMRLLSVTGRNTAEDLKESMDTVTNGGGKHSLEVSAYLNQNILGNKDLSERESGSLNLSMRDSLDNVVKAMGGGDRSALESKLRRGGAGTFNELLLEAQGRFGNDSFGLQTASGAIEKARSAYQNQQNFAYARSQGVNQGGLALATSRALTGDDINSQSMQTLSGLQRALSIGHLSAKDFMTNPAALDSNLAYQQGLKALEIDPSKMEGVRHLLYDSASARIDIAKQGLQGAGAGSDRGKLLEETYQYLARNGAKLDKGDHFSALQKYASSKPGEMMNMLSQWEKTMEDIFNNPVIREALRPQIDQRDRDARMEQAVNLASSTRTTADIFKDAFASFFNGIQTPLDFIADVIGKIGNSKWFGVGADTAEKAGNLDQLTRLVGSQKVDTSLGMDDAKIRSLQDKIKNPSAGDNVELLQKELTDLQAHRAHLASIANQAKDPNLSGKLGRQDVANAIEEANDVDWNYRMGLSQAGTANLFTLMGHARLGQGQSFNLSAKDYGDRFQGLAERLDPSQFSVSQSKDGSTVTITNNNYTSWEATQNQDTTKSPGKAPGETASQTKVKKGN